MQLIIRTPSAQGEVTRNTKLAGQQGLLDDASPDEGKQAHRSPLAVMPDTTGGKLEVVREAHQGPFVSRSCPGADFSEIN
jgi:hypothetical protein